MGQATLDLPDPPNEPSAPRQQSADDLLSQLAAEQIDQLLSDSGTGPKDLGPPPGEAPAGAADPLALPSDEPAPAPLDATKEAISAEAAVAAQLDDLFHQINDAAPEAKKPAGEAAPSEVPAKPQAAVAATAAEVDAALAAGTGPLLPPLEPDAIEEQAEKNERAALDASVEAVAAVGAEIDAQQELESDRLPIYLRPLEWISAPLEYFPDTVREAFGKVAILTLFNSLAVLLYVLIFRRHH
jgi:hypothetical protein